MDLQSVCDGGDLHRGEVVIPKVSMLYLCPCESHLIDLKDIGCKLDLLRP